MELRGFGSSTVTRNNEKENEKEKKQIRRVEREKSMGWRVDGFNLVIGFPNLQFRPWAFYGSRFEGLQHVGTRP